MEKQDRCCFGNHVENDSTSNFLTDLKFQIFFLPYNSPKTIFLQSELNQVTASVCSSIQLGYSAPDFQTPLRDQRAPPAGVRAAAQWRKGPPGRYPVPRFLLLSQASEPLSGSLLISGKNLEVVFQWQTAYSSLAWAVGTKLSPNLKVTKMV